MTHFLIHDYMVASVASQLASYLTGSLAQVLGNALLSGDAFIATHLFGELSQIGDPQLGQRWFGRALARQLSAVELLAMVSLVVAVISATINGDSQFSLKTIVVTLPLVGLFSGAEVPIAALMISAGNGVSNLIFSSFSAGVTPNTALVPAVADLLSPAAPALISVLVGIAFVILGVVVWLELALREAAIYMVVAVLPFAFALSLMRPGRRMLFRLIEVLFGLISIKAVIALGLGIAVALARFGNLSALSTSVMATATLLLCVLSPYAAARFVFGLENATGGMFENAPRMITDRLARAAGMIDQRAANIGVGNSVIDYGEVPFAQGDSGGGDGWERQSVWHEMSEPHDDGR